MEKPNSFYLRYSTKITPEIFEVFQMWIEKNKTGLENRNYCDNTFENFVTKKYYLFNALTQFPSEIYGVDNNAQSIRRELSFEELQELITTTDLW